MRKPPAGGPSDSRLQAGAQCSDRQKKTGKGHMAAHHVYEETKSTTAPIMYRAHPSRATTGLTECTHHACPHHPVQLPHRTDRPELGVSESRFHQFLERMRQPSAHELVRSIKTCAAPHFSPTSCLSMQAASPDRVSWICARPTPRLPGVEHRRLRVSHPDIGFEPRHPLSSPRI